MVLDKKVESRDAYYKMLASHTRQQNAARKCQINIESSRKLRRPNGSKKRSFSLKQFRMQCKTVLKRFCFKMKIFEQPRFNLKADLRQIGQLSADLERSNKMATQGNELQLATIETIEKVLKNFDLKYEVEENRLLAII
jgi:hypothetical protein